MRSAREVFQLWMAHKAAAEALEAELKGRALDAHEAGELGAGPLPGLGRVELRFAKDRVEVVAEYEQAFLAWLRERLPDEVVVTYAPRNATFPRYYLENYTRPLDPDKLAPGQSTSLETDDGQTVPGAKWTKGGKLESVALTRSADLKRDLGIAAHKYAKGAGEMLGLTSGGNRDGKDAGRDQVQAGPATGQGGPAGDQPVAGGGVRDGSGGLPADGNPFA